MNPVVVAFLHFLFWASHFQWEAFAPDAAGNGNHVVYGGNVLDCITVAHNVGTMHGVGGPVPAACVPGLP